MTHLIIPLTQAGEAGIPLVGGKAAALGSLLAVGFSIPPGICLTTTAFHLALAPYRSHIDRILADHNLADPDGATAAATALDDLLVDLALPPPALDALTAALPTLSTEAGPLAVRSSATAEDRPDASFAGQYTTILGVRGLDAVTAAILTCWRSFFSPHALAVRAAHQALTATEGMALLLQPMLDADCAGVAFSLDPVAQTPEVTVVNAVWGLGSGVVEGSVPADTYRIARRGGPLKVIERQLVRQPTRLALAEHGQPVPVPVTEAQRQLPTLSDAWAVRVAELALAAAAARGHPQEIEWAIVAGHLWLLQSRPLTGLPAALAAPPSFPVTWENEAESASLWHLTNLTGRESGLLRPLEHDYVNWRSFSRWESGRWTGQQRIRQARIFNGYTYMGAVDSGLRPGDSQTRQAAAEDLARRLRAEGRTLWEHWGPEVIATSERIIALDLETENNEELAGHLETILGGFRYNWMIHTLLWVESSSKELARAYAALTGEAEEDAGTLLADLIQGEETVLTRMLDALYELAWTARQTPAVAKLVRRADGEALARLHTLPVAAPFRRQLEQFLLLYGNRCGYGYGSETMFQVPTWHEQPEMVLRLLIPYLDPAVEPPAAARARRQAERDAQVEAICAAADNPEAVATFRRELAYARRQAIRLEEHNHYIDQLTEGQLRRALRAAGRRLVTEGVLSATDDVYWLRFHEILNCLQDRAPASPAASIAARKEQYANRQTLQPLPVLGVPDPILPQRSPSQPISQDTDADPLPGRLQGQAASTGRYTGRARIIPGTVLVPDLAPGDVLVAENVGPLWTPLFPILGALILDGGNLGQHAAATAREYGIPAVIRTNNATGRIPEGAQVTVDGTVGEVTWENGEQ